jgi:hypothetical protein
MRLEEARGLLMQVLPQTGWSQVGDLLIAVGNLKAKVQGISDRGFGDGRRFLDRGDAGLINEVIWSLIVQGILVPGLDDSNQLWPFLRLTEYGRQCVAQGYILPHDPDHYLREFREVVPSIDSVVLEYLTEALQCYLYGINRAAAVMLGGASEQAVLLLFESSINSVGDPATKTRYEAELGKAQSIYRKYEIYDKRFATVRSLVPKALSDNIDSLLRGVFDLIRNSRNEAGHPASGMLVDRDVVFSHLRLFIPYCKRIYGLIDWFNSNKT